MGPAPRGVIAEAHVHGFVPRVGIGRWCASALAGGRGKGWVATANKVAATSGSAIQEDKTTSKGDQSPRGV